MLRELFMTDVLCYDHDAPTIDTVAKKVLVSN